MRLTLSKEPAPPDFPWNGSAALPGGTFTDGETEDYVVNLLARTSGVGELPSVSALWLAPPVPNPARNGVTIHFGLPRAATVSLATFDLAGRRVAQLERGRLEAGSHTASWDFRDDNARSLPSGHYIVKLRVGDAVITRQVIRIR
jgi:hypothetical protein